jgi:hypothetical protein
LPQDDSSGNTFCGYLSQLDTADRQGPTVPEARPRGSRRRS